MAFVFKMRMTAEEAVRWYRAQPGNEEAVRANYFDLPVLPAAQRYEVSEEFAEVRRLLGPASGRALLDLGAGNGIASYALACAGWKVTALEPDPSSEIGTGAIREIQRETGLPIVIEERIGDRLPFADASFYAVFARQVLHHVPDLRVTMRELFRLLRAGGRMLALREHVAENEEELEAFLRAHPLHHLYGQENAFPLESGYLAAAREAGFVVRQVWGGLESILNFAPRSESDRRNTVRWMASQRFGLLSRALVWMPGFVESSLRAHTAADRTPGRIFSFLLEKPSNS